MVPEIQIQIVVAQQVGGENSVDPGVVQTGILAHHEIDRRCPQPSKRKGFHMSHEICLIGRHAHQCQPGMTGAELEVVNGRAVSSLK